MSMNSTIPGNTTKGTGSLEREFYKEVMSCRNTSGQAHPYSREICFQMGDDNDNCIALCPLRSMCGKCSEDEIEQAAEALVKAKAGCA